MNDETADLGLKLHELREKNIERRRRPSTYGIFAPGAPMKLSEVRDILKATVYVGNGRLDTQVTCAAASDLMSDLLRVPREGALLLTGLNNIQAVRTAIIAGMEAVVLVRGKSPNPEMIEQASEHDLPLLSTEFNMYSSCGRLYTYGLKSIR